MKTLLFAFVAVLGLLITTTPVTAQWLDNLSPAIPRVAPFGTSSVGSAWDAGLVGADSLAFGSMRQDWRIGVGIENRDIGAVVTQVELGSAAELAGIMRGDVIVAAGTSRLGLIDNNRVVELADVARRSADSFGRVSMLVVNPRTGIRNVVVNMKSTANSFSGSLVVRDGSPIPQGSLAVVELRNASRPFFEVQGGKLTQQISGYGPYTFTMNVDPRFLNPADQYELQAAIYVGNQPVYFSQPFRVNVNGLSQPMNLLLDRSNASSASVGGVVSAGYPSFAMGTNNIAQELQVLLGRQPNSNEMLAWGDFLRNGNSIATMRQRILSNPQLRANYSSDAAYLQHLFGVLKGQVPTQRDLVYWMERLRATGSPETVVAEMMTR